MAAINITGEDFNKTVRGEGITLVDFWASWCGPCMRFKPVFEKAAEANRTTLSIDNVPPATGPASPAPVAAAAPF